MQLYKITLDDYYDDCADNLDYSVAYVTASDPAIACEMVMQQVKEQKPDISGGITIRCLELIARTEWYGEIPHILYLPKGKGA